MSHATALKAGVALRNMDTVRLGIYMADMVSDSQRRQIRFMKG